MKTFSYKQNQCELLSVIDCYLKHLSGKFQIYLDTTWFSMCYHTLLVAWTRYVAICRPCQFRKQRNSTIYISCLMCYVISLIAYFQPWYVTFYYEASAYGMVAEDIQLYLDGGKSQFFVIYHLLIFIGTFSLYRLLILPCICNAIVFLIGQVVITVGISEGRWTIWLILVLFTLTASTDSVTLLIFSGTVRFFPFFSQNIPLILISSHFAS
uniref:Bm2555, isoform a n=1 Tax=Brugia malayi TaxID=6279 RepID=A0A1I9G6N4_BRUMA|nr:Bm2555, isoform a [Brugia malayi]